MKHSLFIVLFLAVASLVIAESPTLLLAFQYGTLAPGSDKKDLEDRTVGLISSINRKMAGQATLALKGRNGQSTGLSAVKPIEYPVYVNGDEDGWNLTATPPGANPVIMQVLLGNASSMLNYEAGLLSLLIQAQGSSERRGDGLVFLDSVESSTLRRQVESYYDPMPYWTAVMPDGTIAMVSTMELFRLDSQLNFLAVQSSKDIGMTSFGIQNAISPSGTIIAPNPLGKELFRFADGSSAPEKIKTDLGMQYQVGAFSNGDALLLDSATKRIMRVDGTSSRDIAFQGLFGAESTGYGIAAVHVDRDDVVWFARMADRLITAYSENGTILRSVRLVPPREFEQSFYVANSAFLVRPDGSFLVSAGGRLFSFDGNGVCLWTSTGTTLLPSGTFGDMMDIGFDPKTGILVQADMYGKRLCRYIDITWCKTHGIDYERNVDFAFDRNLIAIWSELARVGENKAQKEKVLQKRYDLYRLASNSTMEAQSLVDLLALDRTRTDLQQALSSLDQRFSVEKIRRSEQRTRELVARLGPSSALESYWAAMKQYEELVAAQPENRELKIAMRDFAAFYRDADILKQDLPQVDIEAKQISSVFPALIQTYRNDPLGTLEVRNSGKTVVENLRASIFIKRIMDFPSEGKAVASLAPGASTRLKLQASFNTDILDIQEDLQVQAEVSIWYRQGRQEQKTTLYLPVKIHRRSALTWDDSGRLASFITPNEQVVAGFAQLMLAGQKNTSHPPLPAKIYEAMVIADGLGLYGIEYIEDPVSPISKTLGSAEQVDSVRFPRQTLQLRGGDCDDSTALLASLYESVNIETAIMTSPGHVFLAFNTGEPTDRAWIYSNNGLKPPVYGGTIWLPVETTVLHKGFALAIETALEVLTRYPADKIEFISLRSVRERFPPVPLGLSTTTVIEPPSKDIAARVQKSGLRLEGLFYQPTLARLTSVLTGARGASALRTYNQIGVLHGSFGKTEAAIAWYEAGLASYQDSPVLLANLASLLMKLNRVTQAQAVLEKGLAVKKDSLPLNYLMARLLAVQGKTSTGLTYYKTALSLAKEAVADLAGYYEASGSASRAGVDGLKPLGLFE